MARSKLPSITVLVERMRCPVELSHSQVDTQGSLKLRREMEAISRQVLAEAMGTGAFPGKDREHKEECVAQD